jgi:hypothetical protein
MMALLSVSNIKISRFTLLELKMKFTAIFTSHLEALVVITALQLMLYYELITSFLTWI